MILERIFPTAGSVNRPENRTPSAGGTAARRRGWPWFAGVFVLLWLALFQVQTAQAAILYVGQSSATATSTTLLSISRPAATAAGDLMLASISTRKGVSITAPAGWTLINQGVNGEASLAIFYKVAGDASADPGPYEFTSSATANALTGAILAYSGVDPTNPVDQFAVTNTSGTTATAPCVTTTYDGDFVLRILGQREGEPPTTFPGGTTNRVDLADPDTDALLAIAEAAQLDAGPSGTATFTGLENKDSRIATIALVPAGAQLQTPIVFESSAENTALAAAADITIGKPTGTVEGDLLLATLSQRAVNDFTAPSGWELYNQGTNGTDVTLAIFYKVAGASEPASYTFAKNDDTGRPAVGAILRYSGVDVDNPIDPGIDPASAVANGDSASPTAPEVTTTFDDTRVVRVFGQREMNTGIQDAPSCTVNRVGVNADDQSYVGVADAPQYAAGATGTGAFFTDRDREWRAATVVLVPQQVKLAITKTADAPTVSAGESASYTITVDNIGRGAATNVTITDTLPAGFSFASTVSNSCGTGPTAGDVGIVTWGTCTIADGASLTIAYTVAGAVATVGGVYGNPASVSSAETDPVSDSANVTVLDADLAITKTVSDPVPTEGETLVFTVGVTNNGGGTATNVVVADTLPTGVTWVSTVASQGSCAGPNLGAITCDLETLANAASATVTITVTVNAGIGSPGMITNTASVSADQHDPLDDNDTASVTATSCPAGYIQNVVSVSFTGTDPVETNNTSSVCTELLGSPTAVVLGDIALRSMSVSEFLSGLNIDGLSTEALLDLLRTWDPAAAAALVGADRAAILEALRAYLDPDGDGLVVVMQWETLEQQGTVGFYVERQDGSVWRRVQAGLLPALVASPMGAQYWLADPSAGTGETYQYRLIELEARGTTREYGPFRLQPG